MILLSLDASTPKGSVALVEGKNIIAQAQDTSTLSNQILVMMDKVLKKVNGGLEAVDGFCVTTGPGSFTGLRVGVSLIKGLVLATKKPFWGINTLEAFANMVEPASQPIAPIIDARKKEIYTAKFKYQNGDLARNTEDQAITPEELCEQIKEPTIIFGGGVEPYRDLLTSQLGKKFLDKVSFKNQTIAASAAQVATQKFQNSPNFNLDTLAIHYVRKSEAELNLNKSNQEGVKHGN